MDFIKENRQRKAFYFAGRSFKKKVNFFLEDFFKIHQWKKYYITSLPGVFGHKKIDEGSKLLASTFTKNIQGKILDIGCGTGFLSVALKNYAKNTVLTLSDNDIAAIECTRKTLQLNKLKGNIVFSDIYSKISEKFDLIITNPPFHENFKINLNLSEKIIYASKNYLKKRGELRFVVNIHFNYDSILNKNFKMYQIIKKTKYFKVYQAFLN